MTSFITDVRYAFRQVRRSPGFAAVAVVTLALGIGANSAMFTAVNAVLLKPLDYPEPERLVYVYSQFPTLGFDKFRVSPPEYRELQEHSRSFSAIGAWTTTTANLSGIGNPVRVTSAAASAELFEALGVSAELGRVYTSEEDVAGSGRVIVVSQRLWSNVLGADPEIIGRSLEVNGTPRTVVGVMPAGFDIQDVGVDVWAPLALPSNPTNRSSHFLHVVGRLDPGVTLDRAQAELRGLLARWDEIAAADWHVPNDSTHALVATGFHDEMVGDARPILLLLLGAVGFVLLIACANVGNLLLAQAESRQKEVAVRSALGAGRRRLARQFLTEAVTLSVAAGAIGLLIGYWGLNLLLATGPGIPRLDAIGLDGNVLAFTFVVSIATAIIFGLAPLLHLSPRTVGMRLKEGGQRTTAGAGPKRVRNALVVSQIALAVILVIGSGLMLRSFAALQEVDPGFRPDGLLTFELLLPAGTYPDAAERSAFFDRLLQRLDAIPGVESTAMMSGLPPLREVNPSNTRFEGVERRPDGPAQVVDYYQTVGGDYFEAMGIPMVEGRAFNRGDDGAATPVVIVSERLARVVYPGENPIGRRVGPNQSDELSFEIIGIAENVKQGGLDEAAGTELYFYYPQHAALGTSAPSTMNFVVRTPRDPLALAGAVRRAVRELDASLPVARLQTMEQNLAGAVTRPRFLALLLTVFGAVALALAAIGTFGVLSYSVAQRSREIGIRMALGAHGKTVRGMVLWQGLTLAGLGLAIGFLGAFVLTRVMSGLLFGISSTDPVTFLVSPVIFVLVALAASYVPARRATRVDPMIALRAE